MAEEKKTTLEEAADKYNEAMSWAWEAPAHPHKAAFIAGAEWKEQQMMKDAVEGEVENATFGIVYLRKNLVNEGYSTGDKVKIVIVKEERQ